MHTLNVKTVTCKVTKKSIHRSFVLFPDFKKCLLNPFYILQLKIKHLASLCFIKQMDQAKDEIHLLLSR